MRRARHTGGPESVQSAGRGGRLAGKYELVSYWYALSGGASVVVDRPADIQKDDILIGIAMLERTVAEPFTSRPSGFTSLASRTNYDLQVTIDIKIATATEPSSYAWASASTYSKAAIVLVYRARKFQDQKISSAILGSNGGSSRSSFTIPAFTAPEEGLLVAFFAQAYNGKTIASISGGLREVVKVQTSDWTFSVFDDVKSAAGFKAARTVTTASGTYAAVAGAQIQLT